MLHIDSLSAGYGNGTVLHAIQLTVDAGTVHAIVGHNGAGKTTLIHTIAGLITARDGTVHLDGIALHRQPAHRIARHGAALVPQGRRVWASLTVAEHLALAETSRRTGPWTQQRILALLPGLPPRLRHRGSQLSGGEQQMLAIARALLTQPRLLLLDEPTEGLAPALAAQIHALITQVGDEGVTTVLTTPALAVATTVANHISLLNAGYLTARCDAARVSPSTARPTSP